MDRDLIVEGLKLDFLGKKGKEGGVGQDINPAINFLTGILEPINKVQQEEEDIDRLADAHSASSNSSIGVSFLTQTDDRIKGKINFVIYQKTEKRSWHQESISVPFAQEVENLPEGTSLLERVHEDSEKSLDLFVTKISSSQNGLENLIVSLVNSTNLEEIRRPKVPELYFQVGICISSESGFKDLKSTEVSFETIDDRLNALLYENVKVFAKGHGVSVDWQMEGESCNHIKTEFFPVHIQDKVVHKVLEAGTKSIDFDMDELRKVDLFPKWIDKLKSIPSHYLLWLEEQHYSGNYDKDFERNKEIVRNVIQRIEKGIAILETSITHRKAFSFANEAMLLQQLRYKAPVSHKLEEPWEDFDLDNKNSWTKDKYPYGKWRLFQIGFILMNLDEKFTIDKFDLIWFPTGGGKTEAYLGLSAFNIFFKLLSQDNHQGVSIIMRYTLRLLGVQQFERAASLIVAADDIKSKYKIEGPEISIGLLLGSSVTPNRSITALLQLEKYALGEKDGNPFVVNKCPRCSAPFGYDLESQTVIGIKAIQEEVHFSCPSCCDVDEILPVYVVDDVILNRRPTLVVSTVDKFALFAWNPRYKNLITAIGNDSICTWKLIIQDELHLLDGPLGTVTGLYETFIDYIIENYSASVKRVGSTATISNALTQLKGLYCKKDLDVQVFPPPLKSYKDNFFSRLVDDPQGRMFVGVFNNSSPSFKTSQYRLLALVGQLGSSSESESYSTLVSYHNTLKDLGHTRSMLGDDVPQHLKFIHRSYNIEKEKRFYANDSKIVELTSRVGSGDLTMNLDRLSLDKTNNNSVNFCLATNMISVGVDVPRLSTMLINSLPKSVSEYIQATSRVGRGSNPGLVMVLFSSNRMRDKSYYEEFKRFHVEQGRMVESVTITPFSSRSLERVLPTVLFAMIRMSKQSEQLEKPKTLSDTKIKELSDFIVDRCNVIDSKQVSNLEQFLQHFFDKWNFETENKVYGSFNGRALPGVVVNCLATQLHEHSEKAEINRPFVIMSSLRNVDISEGVKVYNNA